MGQGLGCLLTLAPTHLSTDPHTTPNNPSCAPVREAQAQDGLGPQMRHPPRDFGDHARPHPSHDPRLPPSPPLGAGQNAPAEPLFHLNAVQMLIAVLMLLVMSMLVLRMVRWWEVCRW